MAPPFRRISKTMSPCIASCEVALKCLRVRLMFIMEGCVVGKGTKLLQSMPKALGSLAANWIAFTDGWPNTTARKLNTKCCLRMNAYYRWLAGLQLQVASNLVTWLACTPSGDAAHIALGDMCIFSITFARLCIKKYIYVCIYN